MLCVCEIFYVLTPHAQNWQGATAYTHTRARTNVNTRVHTLGTVAHDYTVGPRPIRVRVQPVQLTPTALPPDPSVGRSDRKTHVRRAHLQCVRYAVQGGRHYTRFNT